MGSVGPEAATKRRVLVVDDDRATLKLLDMALKAEGYDTLFAERGREALREVYRSRPDAIILDVMMPEMDGFEVCGRIREMSDIPVILLTAKGMECDVVRGLECGADDYVTKPFSLAELMARLRATLRRSEMPRSTGADGVLVAGDLRMNMMTKSVTIGGRKLRLTPTEFRLLAALVRRAGEVVPHRELVSAAWGSGDCGETQYLKLYVGYLRSKVEDDPRHPRHLLNERGMGYRFVP